MRIVAGRLVLFIATAYPLAITSRTDLTAPVGSFAIHPARQGGVFLVHCNINGKRKVSMVLDTGSGNISVSNSIVKQLGLTPSPLHDSSGKPIVSGSSTGGTIPAVELESIQADDCLPFVKGQAKVIEDRLLRSISADHVDGILGQGAFGSTSLMIDFQEQRVSLWYPSKLTEEDLAASGMANAREIPADVRNLVFYVQAELSDGVVEKMAIDTGASRTGISAATARRLGLSPVSTSIRKSAQGDIKVATAMIPSLHVMGLTLENIPIEYPLDDTINLPEHLGLDVLVRLTILMDIPNKKLRVKTVIK